MATTEGAAEDAVRTIRAMDREFMENVAAKRASRVATVYAGDARILMPGQPFIAGKSEILAFYQAALAGPVQAITLDTTQIEVSGDLAYAFGNNTIMLQPAGEAAREEKGKYVVVYRRQTAGDWKIVVDSYSSTGRLPILVGIPAVSQTAFWEVCASNSSATLPQPGCSTSHGAIRTAMEECPVTHSLCAAPRAYIFGG